MTPRRFVYPIRAILKVPHDQAFYRLVNGSIRGDNDMVTRLVVADAVGYLFRKMCNRAGVKASGGAEIREDWVPIFTPAEGYSKEPTVYLDDKELAALRQDMLRFRVLVDGLDGLTYWAECNVSIEFAGAGGPLGAAENIGDELLRYLDATGGASADG